MIKSKPEIAGEIGVDQHCTRVLIAKPLHSQRTTIVHAQREPNRSPDKATKSPSTKALASNAGPYGVIQLVNPTVLLGNLAGTSLLHFESVLRVSIHRLGGIKVDVFDLGFSGVRPVDIAGQAPTLVLLKIPNPMRDAREFEWTHRTLRQLSTRAKTHVLPVIRENEQLPTFLRSIAQLCPYYITPSSDFREHCRLLTMLLRSMV